MSYGRNRVPHIVRLHLDAETSSNRYCCWRSWDSTDGVETRSCEHRSSSRYNKEFGIFMYYIYFEWRNHPSLCTLAKDVVPEVNGPVALEAQL